MLFAAPPPEGDRGGALAGARCRAPYPHGRGCGGACARRRLRGRRHRRVHRDRRRDRVLLPGDEHAPAGRAPGDRARLRRRPRRAAAARRGRRAARAHSGAARPARARGRGPPLRRGPRGRVPAVDRHDQGVPGARRRGDPRRLRRARRQRDRHQLRPDAREGDRPRPRPRERAAAPGPRACELRPARRCDERRVHTNAARARGCPLRSAGHRPAGARPVRLARGPAGRPDRRCRSGRVRDRAARRPVAAQADRPRRGERARRPRERRRAPLGGRRDPLGSGWARARAA